jgi:hypothetical protein
VQAAPLTILKRLIFHLGILHGKENLQKLFRITAERDAGHLHHLVGGLGAQDQLSQRLSATNDDNDWLLLGAGFVPWRIVQRQVSKGKGRRRQQWH